MNEKDVRTAYRFLRHQDETEIRLVAPPKSIFVTSEDEFVNVCREYDGKQNVYVGANERKPGKRLQKDVRRWHIVPIDIDAIRESGNKHDPATVEEVMKAELLKQRVINYLVKRGCDSYLDVMSGNGWQIWIRIPKYAVNEKNWMFLNEKSNTFQALLRYNFTTKRSDGGCGDFHMHGTIDAIGNLDRILKVPGTMSKKGVETKERKHRLARIVDIVEGDSDSFVFADYILGLKSGEIPGARSKVKGVDISYEEFWDKYGDDTILNNEKVLEHLKKGLHDSADRSQIDFALASCLLRLDAPYEMIWGILKYRKNSKAAGRSDGNDYLAMTIAKAEAMLGRVAKDIKEKNKAIEEAALWDVLKKG